jgi:hypothetical protein
MSRLANRQVQLLRFLLPEARILSARWVCGVVLPTESRWAVRPRKIPLLAKDARNGAPALWELSGAHPNGRRL